MDFKISCSFGEVVDKYSILKIKESKIQDKQALQNIRNEIQALEDVVVSLSTFIINNKLYHDLLSVNKKLWILEDLIREKSQKKEFDDKYIRYAESIHETNDKRYRIKREINKITNSKYIEEKSYNFQIVSQKDKTILERAKILYISGQYETAYTTIKELTNKFSDVETPNMFNIELFISAQNIFNVLGYNDSFMDTLHKIMAEIEHYGLDTEFVKYCKNQYCLFCLKERLYTKAYPYLNLVGIISGPGVSYDNMSFPDESDHGKNILIYDGGGIGDKLMLSRFIPDICAKYKNHTITFFLDDNVIWVMKSIFHNIRNLKIVPYSNPRLLGRIDNHFNLMMSLRLLNIEYDNLKFTPLLKDIQTNVNEHTKEIIVNIKNIRDRGKKVYVFNWKGNPKNTHEKHNRRMNIMEAIHLFKRPDIQWIVITKDIDAYESKILKKYNVMYIGDTIDSGNDCFYDSIEILRHVNGVVTTDTSIAHLSLNLGIPTHVLLTIGNEWRWGRRSQTTLWYPESRLYIQKRYGVWKDVLHNFSICT